MQPSKTYLTTKNRNSVKLLRTYSAFLNQFVMLHEVKNTIRLYLAEDPSQNIKSGYSNLLLQSLLWSEQ